MPMSSPQMTIMLGLPFGMSAPSSIDVPVKAEGRNVVGAGHLANDSAAVPLVPSHSAEHPGSWKVMAMYDKNLDTKWHVEIDFDEDETHTHATVRAQRGDGETVTTLGDAYRNPRDGS